MSEITTSNSHIEVSQGCCDYCGAVLSPAFYFCHICATPYKPIELIAGRVAYQPVESEQIRQKAPNVWPVFWSYAVVIFIMGIFSYILGDAQNARIYTLITGTVLFLSLRLTLK